MHRSQPVIIYIRVSTERHGRSGFGIKAQRAAVREYLAGIACEQVAEFVKIESGTRRDRSQLAAALSAACLHRAVLGSVVT